LAHDDDYLYVGVDAKDDVVNKGRQAGGRHCLS
jgi:hypothetical protein